MYDKLFFTLDRNRFLSTLNDSTLYNCIIKISSERPRINKSKPIINIRHDSLLLLVHFLGKKTYAKLEVSQHDSIGAKSV
jgi:hypothetical protein